MRPASGSPGDQESNSKGHHSHAESIIMEQIVLPLLHDLSQQMVQEVWTLCRILKRNGSYRKCLPEWRSSVAAAAAKQNPVVDHTLNSKTCSTNSSDYIISFGAPVMKHSSINTHENKPFSTTGHVHHDTSSNNQIFMGQLNSTSCQTPSLTTPAVSYSSFGHTTLAPDMNELLKHGDYWDELRSVLDLASC